MAAKKNVPEATILVAKQLIFNRLCTVYLRFKNSDPVDAVELRCELNLPETIFAEALLGFLCAEDQRAVEVLEDKGRTYLRLGEAGRDICTDWSPKEKRRLLRKAEPSVDIPVDRLVTRYG
jgi:hypothetical protein